MGGRAKMSKLCGLGSMVFLRKIKKGQSESNAAAAKNSTKKQIMMMLMVIVE